ncbi:unnamed protein product [Rangifer tarandus platyrhynchus]|uniref:Uncharacterized protein n=1 Tax=Rangifer tarandus platyrhynchus TaxID=3082113 RepID=A0AC59ZUW5_RANTA
MGSMLGVFAHLQGGQDAAGHRYEGLRQEEQLGRRWASSEQQLRGWRVGTLGCPQAAGVLDLRALFSSLWPVRPLSVTPGHLEGSRLWEAQAPGLLALRVCLVSGQSWGLLWRCSEDHRLDGGWTGQAAGGRLLPSREQSGWKEGTGEGHLAEPGSAQRLAALLRAVAGRLRAASQV